MSLHRILAGGPNMAMLYVNYLKIAQDVKYTYPSREDADRFHVVSVELANAQHTDTPTNTEVGS